MTYEERTAEFKARIDAGEKIEATDWMPDEYRDRRAEVHRDARQLRGDGRAAGARVDRPRPLAAPQDVADREGPGRGRPRPDAATGSPRTSGSRRDAMIADLVHGRTKFHNVFHYPTYTWGDVAVIGFLIDGAALVTQKALLDCSYAPYVACSSAICAEESLHQRHGEDLDARAGGGHRTSSARCSRTPWTAGGSRSCTSSARPRSRARTSLLYWGLKSRVQRGPAPAASSPSTCPSCGTSASQRPRPRAAVRRGQGRVDLDRARLGQFWQVVKGNGPMTETRLAWRRWMHEAHGWVREALATTPTAA